MASYRGRLFVGTLPSGRVLSLEAGKNVTYDRALSFGWHHITATRGGQTLKLYIDGELVAESARFDPRDFDLNSKAPLYMGFGAQDFFRGRLADVRIHRGELSASEIRSLSKQRSIAR